MRLYHISEEKDIARFHPRPSPQRYTEVSGDVVFAISEEMLHLYLVPRNCPRVAWYAGPGTSDHDRMAYLSSGREYAIAVEPAWRTAIRNRVLYCYQFEAADFELLDGNAGYYICYKEVTPIAVREIRNPLQMMTDRGVEVIFTPSLWSLAEEVQQSTLRYSLIRMSCAGGLRPD